MPCASVRSLPRPGARPAGMPGHLPVGRGLGLARRPKRKQALLGSNLSGIRRQHDRNVMPVLSWATAPDSSILGVFHASKNPGGRPSGSGGEAPKIFDRPRAGRGARRRPLQRPGPERVGRSPGARCSPVRRRRPGLERLLPGVWAGGPGSQSAQPPVCGLQAHAEETEEPREPSRRRLRRAPTAALHRLPPRCSASHGVRPSSDECGRSWL